MGLQELKKEYGKRKKEIKSRLDDFSQVKGENVFYEFCFCLLTPQSNAYKCDECVQVLKKKDFKNKSFQIKPILRKKTRFHNNKSSYLVHNKKQYEFVEKVVNRKDKCKVEINRSVREWLVGNVKGMGYKEASHFLRNIGYRSLAILDRHVLKNLVKLNVLKDIPKSLTRDRYLEIEQKFIKFSRIIKIPMDEIDLLFWSMETGKVFK